LKGKAIVNRIFFVRVNTVYTQYLLLLLPMWPGRNTVYTVFITTSSDAVRMDGGQEVDLAEWGVGAFAANPEEDIPDSDETSRLAVVDLDWSQVTHPHLIENGGQPLRCAA
jgi:hypothetical protein